MPWTVELRPERPKSVATPGGSPALDRAYQEWRDALLGDAADRDCARRWHDAADRPLVLDAWRFDRFLFRSLRGGLPLFGTGAPTTPNHRLRFLAVCLLTRRRQTHLAAHRFIAEANDAVCGA